MATYRPPALVGAALVAALAVSGCTTGPAQRGSSAVSDGEGSGSGATAPTASGTLGSVRTLVKDLQAPWSVVFHGDTPLISERDTGEILEVESGGDTRVVGRVPGVVAEGEGGLLGLAVRGDDLYAYSGGRDGNRIQRFELEGETGALRLGSADALVDGLPQGTFHNGGRLAFGPDGMLYASVGDAGESEKAQDRDALNGKILRMTPDGEVPKDNPFEDSLVYSYGHRNPQGLAWDEEATMYASEFGQDTWDELNVIKAGKNYGWPEVEGKGGPKRYVDPVQQWRPSEASPSGITVHGSSIYMANLKGERLLRIPLDKLGSSREVVTGQGRLRDVVTSPDGDLWALTNNTDGRGSPRKGDDRLLRVPAR